MVIPGFTNFDIGLLDVQISTLGPFESFVFRRWVIIYVVSYSRQSFEVQSFEVESFEAESFNV